MMMFNKCFFFFFQDRPARQRNSHKLLQAGTATITNAKLLAERARLQTVNRGEGQRLTVGQVTAKQMNGMMTPLKELLPAINLTVCGRSNKTTEM